MLFTIGKVSGFYKAAISVNQDNTNTALGEQEEAANLYREALHRKRALFSQLHFPPWRKQLKSNEKEAN